MVASYTAFNVLVGFGESRLSCWGVGGACTALDAEIVVAQNGSEGLGAPMFDLLHSGLSM
jgi:hypothetical protein